MTLCDGRLVRLVGSCLLLAVCAIYPRQGAATIDFSGRWSVQGDDDFLYQGFSQSWDVVQSGSAVTIACVPPDSCSYIGTIDPNTGVAVFPPLPPPPNPCTAQECLSGIVITPGCNPSVNCYYYPCSEQFPVDVQVSADGRAFTGTQKLLFPIFFGGQCFPAEKQFVGSRCINGVVDPGEQCDDGNLQNGDGCDANCTFTACGNGVVTAGEQCDDGNTDSSDACKNDCTPNVCGDGVVRTGVEACDDGNLINGDGCSSTCQPEVFVSGGGKAADCLHAWLTSPAPLTGRGGVPRNQLVCTDDDPTCDVGSAHDGACTFRVAMCFNLPDATNACTPTSVHTVNLVHPGTRPNSSTDAENRAALEAALVGIGAGFQGMCANVGARGQACAQNTDCNTGRGDGNCQRLAVFAPANPQQKLCTDFASIVVPLSGGGSGRSRLRLVATAGGTAPKQRDTDSLRLVCKPHR